MQKQRRTQKRRRRDERQSRTRRAELRSAEQRPETRAERRQKRDAECRQRRDAERRQRRKQSAGRDENRLETETQSESENTSNDSLKLELVRRALLYSESAMAAVASHWESDLHEHANGCRIGHTSSASSAAHSSSSRALLHTTRMQTRTRDNTAYTLTMIFPPRFKKPIQPSHFKKPKSFYQERLNEQ